MIYIRKESTNNNGTVVTKYKLWGVPVIKYTSERMKDISEPDPVTQQDAIRRLRLLQAWESLPADKQQTILKQVCQLANQ